MSEWNCWYTCYMKNSWSHLTSDLCLGVEDESVVESCRNLFDQFLAYAILQQLLGVDLDDPHKSRLH